MSCRTVVSGMVVVASCAVFYGDYAEGGEGGGGAVGCAWAGFVGGCRVRGRWRQIYEHSWSSVHVCFAGEMAGLLRVNLLDRRIRT